ncbi:hypothetical protein [Humisphaera borealis]|uniref:Tetratricopeptide repeat protein n=1 Tax=Humisphaera borealis TaxID=2807512 RepID=A0A7M2WZW6_9BACT|nr:hypothetical protein [Humisphaera borealis]QOV90924.1 hypothetical protein IPV69_06065 [Humisphaera borealis]
MMPMTCRRTGRLHASAWWYASAIAAAMPLAVLAKEVATVRPGIATQPTLVPASAPSAATIAEAIDALGDEDFRIREKAVRTLWEFGEAARPALVAAVSSDNPEIARRAKSVLASFAFGVRPDTPQPVIDLLNMYRQGEPEQRKSVAGELARQGVPGARVLLKLSEDEKDPVVRQVVLNAMGMTSRPAVAQMIHDRDFVVAERFLAALAPHVDYAARDHAAFLLLHGGLEQQIAVLRKPAEPNRPAAMQQLRLASLLRAKGDYVPAAEAALAANDTFLHGALMADAGKYADLAAMMQKRGIADDNIEELSFITAFFRLAGDTVASDRWAGKLVEYANQNASDHFNAVEALMLNERADQAIDVLVSKQNHLAAADYLAARLEFKRLDEVVTRAREQGSTDLPKILCRYAQMQHFRGDSKGADATMLAVARGEHGPVDFSGWVDLATFAPGAGIDRGMTDSWVAQGLVVARPQDDVSRMFDRVGFADSARAQSWWRVLRDHRAAYTPNEGLALVRRIDRKEVPADEMAKLLDKTRELAATLPGGERHVRLRLVADTLAESGKIDEAIEIARWITTRSAAVEHLLNLGELCAKAEKWNDALDAFAKAHDADPSSPNPVALQAWALTRLGRSQEAAALIETAHLMPLGNESVRHSLADVFTQHGMKAEGDRERQLTARLGDPSSWEVCDSVRRMADDISTTDALAAAAMWDRAFLANLTTRTMFVDPSANLTIPVLIRRTKAIGKIAKGDLPGALADAEACFRIMPAEADAQIAIVRELDKAGHKAEADIVYQRAFTYFRDIQKQYPESAPANNLVAWLCGSVKRDLDYALACARKGVELEPQSTAILDTLSEVYFARGEFDEAIAINQRCRDMEPHLSHHRENLERFTKARDGKKP